MNSNLLATIIIQICAGDLSIYYVQDYPQDCHHYYINCAVDTNGEMTEKTLKRCQDGKHKAKEHSIISE